MAESQSNSKITTQNLRKINHTVESMKEQMKITETEKMYRLENFKFYDLKEDYIKRFKCTKCDKSFRSVIERGKEVCVHPLLEVLMCFSCCDYYGDGNFSMGSDDEDKYCRWCGEGGIIFSCSKCICGFCNQCIKKHFGEETLKNIEDDDDWKCYFCDPKPLWFLRGICSLAKEISETKKNQKTVKNENKSLKRKRSKMKFSKDYFSSSDDQNESVELNADDENESVTKGKKIQKKRKSDVTNLDNSSQEVNDKKFEENEKQILHKFKEIWKITQLLMEIGLKASGERLNILTQLNTVDTIKDFQKEYTKLKVILDTIRSYLDKTIDTANSLKHELDFGNEVDEEDRAIAQDDVFAKDFQQKIEVEFKKINSAEVVKPILKVKSFAKMTSDNLLNPRSTCCSTKTGKNEIEKKISETKAKQAHFDEYNKETDESCEEKSLSEKQSNTSSDSEFSTDDEPYIVIKRSKKRLNKTRSSRRNIRKVLNKELLQRDTKEAVRYEEEKQKRLQERKKLFEELFLNTNTEMEEHKQLVLDFDEETKEPLVVVHKNLATKLKPHQIEGIKFMWNNCFESVKRLEKDCGTGCILAHCMGFGKTLQVITLIHTVMSHDLGVSTVLIISPFGIISTWINEFDTWLKDVDSDFINIYDLLNIKNNKDRAYYIEQWQKNGGIMIISYDLFRNLTKCYSNSKKKMFKLFENALLNPGPDLVICDEGHLIKNAESILSKCINKIKTARRIVLTGTPLQNNLLEYYCMVQFVKPNFLGSKKEFSNRFINPIVNGQFEDSTEQDVKLMKRRSHVLHSMLKGCVQRFDFSVLASYLPEKKEFAILISLTNSQINAYNYFIKTLSGKVLKSSEVTTLFNDFHYLQRIWTHPRALLIESNKDYERKTVQTDSEGSLKDFIVHTDEEESTPSSSNEKESSVEEIVLSKKSIFNANGLEPVQGAEEEIDKTIDKYWWEEFFFKKDFEDIHASNKLLVLFSLLVQCEKVGEKVLVFSQSLNSLDIIEYFLNKVDENCSKDNTSLGSFQDSWLLGIDYFRLDGSTSSETRAAWCRSFNLLSNKRARLFLISTKAGGLGINLCGANRVVIFDASWNPSNDLQSIFRVYRFGQNKKCYIYRFLAEGTMEEKIYKRQITKLSLAERVVDEHQIERHYSMGNLQDLYNFEPIPQEKRKTPNVPQDNVLAELLSIYKDEIVAYHEQDCLLENKEEEELSEQEKQAAWRDYNEEKLRNNICNINFPHNVQNISVCKPNFVGNNITEAYANPFAIQSAVPLNILQQEVHSYNRTQIPK